MQNDWSRTQLLLGEQAVEKLAKCHVAVFGVGGVGGYVVEALARSGVGALSIFDNDVVCPSNINRQIIATQKTMGLFKVDVAMQRIAEINPDCMVFAHKMFVLPSNARQIDLSQFDYAVDAIDTVAGKLALVQRAAECNVPVISAMGAAGKLDPTAFEVADIYQTSVCPLAKVMRRELRKLDIDRLKVVYSKEEPRAGADQNQSGKHTPGSVAFVPPVMGLIIAGEVIKDLTGVR